MSEGMRVGVTPRCLGCCGADLHHALKFDDSELLKTNRDYSVCANTSVAVLKHDAPEMVCMGFPTVVRIHPACIRSVRLRGQLLEESG